MSGPGGCLIQGGVWSRGGVSGPGVSDPGVSEIFGGVSEIFGGGCSSKFFFSFFFSISFPQKKSFWDAHTPPLHPPRRSMRGRYASYWNAFLLSYATFESICGH